MRDSINVVTVVQTRTGSTRLPDKVLKPLLDKPAFVRMVERVQAAELAGTVIVATTTAAEDDIIAGICEREGLLCFRGHPTDLLDRHYQVARRYNADAVVKIPSDCVLIDPAVIDRVIDTYLARPQAYDYVSNLHPESYPDGNDVEIMSMAALETAWQEATRDFEREHTTPYLWEQPERFRLKNVTWETGQNYVMTHRYVLDYEEDYRLINLIFETLYPRNPIFTLDEILTLFERQPELRTVNAKYLGVNWYIHHADDLKTVAADEFYAPGELHPPEDKTA